MNNLYWYYNLFDYDKTKIICLTIDILFSTKAALGSIFFIWPPILLFHGLWVYCRL